MLNSRGLVPRLLPRVAWMFWVLGLMTACGGEDAGLAAPGPATPPAGGGTADVAGLARAYLDVVQLDPGFDECWSGAPEAAGRCLRGPRSGSVLGDAVHRWIRTEWSAIPEIQYIQAQRFAFPHYRVQSMGLRADLGEGPVAVSSFPWFGQGLTGTAGVTAPLAPAGLPLLPTPDVNGKIALLRFTRQFNADAAATHETLRAAEAAGAVAAVATFDAPGNLIAAHNHDIRNPLGSLPTLIVGKQDFSRLAAAAGTAATLTLNATAADGRVDNSIAILPGRDPRMLVIGTPMNTWLTGGGERAPGAAILVTLARQLAARVRQSGPLPYTVVLLATGGHEVYGYGLERSLGCLDADAILAYVHLGAGLVSQGHVELLGQAVPRPGLTQTRAMVMSENPVLEALVDDAFGGAGLGPFFRFEAGRAAPGEAEVAYNLGLPMVSLTGANPYHHTVEDDAAQIVFEALPAMAAAYQRLVEGLLDMPFAALQAANAEADALRGDNPGYPCAGPIAGIPPALQRAP